MSNATLSPLMIGAIAPFGSLRTIPIEFPGVESCDQQSQGSVIFGAPSDDSGRAQATLVANRFVDPRCSGSRFTVFPRAVRHELGVQP